MKRLVLTAVLAAGVAVWAAASAIPTDDQAIAHVLNRVGFGPRPGDIAAVRSMGLAAYIDQQLHPERIPDAAIGSRLAALSTVSMSSRDIAQQFALPVIQARLSRKQNAGEPPQVAPQQPPR